MLGRLIVVAVAAGLTGCAEQSAMRISNDTVQLHISTAPIYGALEPQRRAMLMAAEETVKNGFDKFLILDSASTYKPNVIGVMPAYGQSSSQASVANGYGQASSQSTYVGPRPIAMPRFESGVIVKMFKAADPTGANAINAHDVLKRAKAG